MGALRRERRCGGGERGCGAAQARRPNSIARPASQAEEAEAQAFLFYCFIFGQSLLFVERGPRKRSQLVAKSAEKLLD